MMRSLSRLAALAAAVALLVIAPGAQAQRGLRNQSRDNAAQRQAAKARLQTLKAEESTRRNELSSAQYRAEEAQGEYRAVRRRLDRTRSEVRRLRTEYADAVARQKKQDKEMQERLVRLYMSEQPSYVEVLLEARDFEDLLDRTQYMQVLAKADSDLLFQFLDEKRRTEELKAQCEAKAAQQTQEAAEADRKRAEYEAAERRAAQLLQQANTQRAAAERQLAALEEAGREIQAMLRALAAGQGGRVYVGRWNGRWVRPVGSTHITSGFGYRIHPLTGTRRFHEGVDFGAGYGSSIRAAAKGLVVHSGWWGPYGKCIIVDHGGGWSTLYGHCSSLLVGQGQVVAAGQTIGLVGSTGWSTGPHLHFGVYRNGAPVSPLG